MQESCSLVDNSNIDEKVQKIIRQTNYTHIIAREKLEEFQFDEVFVIKDYFGIADKKPVTSKNASLNQEIYRQLRTKMNTSKIPQNLLPTT